MQDEQLSLATLLDYGTTVYSDSQIVTWTGDGVRGYSFGELGLEAARLANALVSLGVEQGDRVGTFMWNNNEHMAAYAGIPAMGAVLHTLNIRLFPEQLVFVTNHLDDKVILVDATVAPLLAAVLPQLRSVKHIIVCNGDAEISAPGVTVHAYRELLDAQPTTYAWPDIDERWAAAACYTSGTTGDPKGVIYSHRSMWLHSMQVCTGNGMGLSESDNTLAIVPMFHAMSWGLPHASLMCGASLVMPDRFLQPGPIAEILASQRPTFSAAVPTIWLGLLQHLEANPQDISHLRSVVVGGSAVPPSLMHAFQDKFNVPILQAWGMTETSPLASVAHAPSKAEGDERWKYRYTQGRYPANVRMRIVGDDGQVLAPDGESVGEVEVRGAWITGAYYSPDGGAIDPDKFRDGWLRTGDVGHVSKDGYLTLVDRSKDVIKSGGEWISSVDLENDVMSNPDVAEAAVVGVPDEKWDERPLVAVVRTPGSSITAEELRAFLDGKVAKWQLPERWTFVDEVPKTSVGKFDKKRIRAQYADGELDIVTLG